MVRSIIDNNKLTTTQYVVMFVGFIINLLDGMDVLVIAYTAPAISREWEISPEALGIVFSAALAGMLVGALFVAPLADRIGRKKMIFISALAMGLSVYFTAYSNSLVSLLLLRFLSGIGVGAMLASVSTLASEYAPETTRSFWVSVVVGGYPVGATSAGLIAAYIIPNFGWRAMFELAGIVTLATLPVILLYLPESLDYLISRQPKKALYKVNRILGKMKAPRLSELPVRKQQHRSLSLANLFAGDLQNGTLLLWSAFFLSYITLYFMMSWIPKLTTLAGMPESFGIYSGTIFNGGAFIGIITLGRLAIRGGLRRMIFIFLGAAAVLMMIFGTGSGSIVILILFGLIGFSLQGGFVGLYSVATSLYPTEVRSTGVGWAIGIGRFGAVVGPVLAGYLVGAGLSLTTNFVVFSVPILLAGYLVLKIKSKNIN